jgi:tRNA nucleotidyltransferase (CCA-adding enzyme)
MEKIQLLLEQVTKLLYPFPVYAVGGCVRDYILGIQPKDFDFTTPASPEIIEEKIREAGRKPFLVGKKFGTIGCKIELEDKQWEQVEITTFRTESYSDGNRKPEVEFVTSITEDLSRRDFTINALAFRLDKKNNLKLIDPFNGISDLKNKILRCVGFPKQRFKEDPLRILRAIRFACRFDLAIEEKTYEKLCHCVPELLSISKERWMNELDKILINENAYRGILLLWETKIFNWIIPELSLQLNYNQNSQYHSHVLHEHTALVVNNCPKDLNLRWAALLHDIAKPFVRTDKEIYMGDFGDGIPGPKGWGKKSNYIGHAELGAEMVKRIALHLKWSNDRTEKVIDLVRNHLEDTCELRKYDNEGKQ